MALAFRALARSDFPEVMDWLSAPHVAQWWRDAHGPRAVESQFGPVVDGRDPTEVSIVEEDGRDIGLIQRYRLGDNPEWERVIAVGTAPRPAVGIDYLIGDASRVGEGLGPRLIACFVEDTWDCHPDAQAVVVAVQQANRRSWRALEKAGFQRDWSGTLACDDPGDAGPNHVYVCLRPI
jgi:aminoglycoside 6'-N-acetyltransferase